MTFRSSFLSRINSRLIGISAAISAVAYARLVSRERPDFVSYWMMYSVLSTFSQLGYLSLGLRLDILILLAALGMLMLTCIAFAVAFAWLGLRVFGSRMAFWRNVM